MCKQATFRQTNTRVHINGLSEILVMYSSRHTCNTMLLARSYIRRYILQTKPFYKWSHNAFTVL